MSLRAWAHLPLVGALAVRAGSHRLGMHPEPVVRGPNAARADALEGFVLCLHITSCGSGPATRGMDAVVGVEPGLAR